MAIIIIVYDQIRFTSYTTAGRRAFSSHPILISGTSNGIARLLAFAAAGLAATSARAPSTRASESAQRHS
jgi:hypothetical protein